MWVVRVLDMDNVGHYPGLRYPITVFARVRGVLLLVQKIDAGTLSPAVRYLLLDNVLTVDALFHQNKPYEKPGRSGDVKGAVEGYESWYKVEALVEVGLPACVSC